MKYLINEGLDMGLNTALEIIELRLEYYDVLVRLDEAGEIEWEIIEELEVLRDMIKKLNEMISMKLEEDV